MRYLTSQCRSLHVQPACRPQFTGCPTEMSVRPGIEEKQPRFHNHQLALSISIVFTLCDEDFTPVALIKVPVNE